MLGYRKTYTLPFKFEIPNYSGDFLKKTSVMKRWLKYIKRYFYIVIKRQNKLEIFNILPKHKKILWINVSAPSLGDSLMDLSSRLLLKDYKVDLFTDKKNSELYKDDFKFSRVITDKNQVVDSKYDLVILDSYSTRSIQAKVKLASLTPFIGIINYMML